MERSELQRTSKNAQSTKSVFNNQPAKVVVWEEFSDDAGHYDERCEELIPDPRINLPHRLFPISSKIDVIMQVSTLIRLCTGLYQSGSEHDLIEYSSTRTVEDKKMKGIPDAFSTLSALYYFLPS